jgi:hypothetical protein
MAISAKFNTGGFYENLQRLSNFVLKKNLTDVTVRANKESLNICGQKNETLYMNPTIRKV